MKAFAVLLFTVVTVNAGSHRFGRQAGWSVPPSPPTPGWTTTLPPTTTGWPADPPTTTSGWSAPPPPSSAILASITLDAALAAVGSGWAGENHADNVQVVGAGGSGPNAELVISSSGVAELDQYGDILQVTSQDSNPTSVNLISVSQLAGAAEEQYLDALGVSISNEQSGWGAANGEGASAAAGDTVIQVIPVSASMGMAKP